MEEKYDAIHVCEECGKETYNKINNKYICPNCIDKKQHPGKVYKSICLSCGEPTDNVFSGLSICLTCQEKELRQTGNKKDKTGGKYVCIKCGNETDGNENGEPICEACSQLEDAIQDGIDDRGEETSVICPNCLETVPFLIDDLCEKCQDPISRAARAATAVENNDNKEDKDKKESEESKKSEDDFYSTPTSKKSNTTKDDKNNKTNDTLSSNKESKSNSFSPKKDNQSKSDKSSPNRDKIKDKITDKVVSKSNTAQKAKEAKKKVEQIKKTVKNVKKAAGIISKVVSFFSTPPGWVVLCVLGIIIALVLVSSMMSGIMSSFTERGLADKGTKYEWNKKEFTEDWQDKDGNWFDALYKGYQGYNIWSGGSEQIGDVNYVAKMPLRTRDLRDTANGFIANAVIPKNTAKTTNNKKDYVICQPSVELHLATKGNSHNPWAEGAHKQIKELNGKGYSYIKYMTGPNAARITKQEWIDSGSPTDVTFRGGAFGYMTPENEQFYVNMRWPYASSAAYDGKIIGKQKDYFGKKVIIVNTKTKKMAVGVVGDFGPASGLGTPPGNRMAGLSPDLMYYLTDGKTGDNQTQIEIAFAVDQNVPLGPFMIGTGVGNVQFHPYAKASQINTARKLMATYTSENYPGINQKRIVALSFAFSHLGDEYVPGANGPHKFDCSHFVVNAWKAQGIKGLAATLGKNADQNLGRATASNVLKNGIPGDLMYHSNGGKGYTGHVIMYAGKIGNTPYYVHCGGARGLYSWPSGDHAVTVFPLTPYYQNAMTLVRYDRMN